MTSVMKYGVCLLLALLCLSCLPTSSAQCVDPAPIQTGDTINVAILLWLADVPPGLYTGDILSTRATTTPGYGISFVQPYMLGIDLYVQAMRKQGALPLSNGKSVNLNFVYINMANTVIMPVTIGAFTFTADSAQVDYSANKTYFGFPIFLGASTSAALPGSFMFAGAPAYGIPGGMIYDVISQDPTVLKAKFGIDTPFTFIVPPALFLGDSTVFLANLVEDKQTHIIMHPFVTDQEMFVCDKMPQAAASTPDCYPRGRVQGTRRFNTLFSTLADVSYVQNAAMEHFHTLGIESIMIIYEPYQNGSTAGYWASLRTVQTAKSLGIPVLDNFALAQDPECILDFTQPQADIIKASLLLPPYCVPAADQLLSQKQHFANHEMPSTVAARIATINPDALVIMGSPNSPAAYSLAQLFMAFREMNWTPKAVSISGGFENLLERFAGSDITSYLWNSKPWDPLLSGSAYEDFGSESDFQLLPSTADLDSPGVFAAAYEAKYGPSAPGGPHPFYSSTVKINSVPAIAYATLERVQKMIEAGLSKDVPTLMNAAKSMSTPGMYAQVQFDVYGRTVRTNEVLQQKLPNSNLQILSPYNIAQKTIYPLPTWSERVFNPQFYQESGEKALVAITSVCITIVLAVLGLVLVHHADPVIRAATPSFCVCTTLGCALMMASNYFATLVVNDAHCAANAWLLTTGFTLAYAALFLKTFRLWRIFGTKQLQVVKIKNSELLMAVAAFLLVDVIINAVWQGTGLHAKHVTVDPIRPSYDYMTCDYQTAGPVYVHLAIKCGLILFGVALTYAVRNAPSQFNESLSISLSIYNLTVALAFGIPIVAVGLGGRSTTYLIRGFILLFIGVSTCCLLYIPKLMIIYGKRVTDTVTKITVGTTGGNETNGSALGSTVGGVTSGQNGSNPLSPASPKNRTVSSKSPHTSKRNPTKVIVTTPGGEGVTASPIIIGASPSMNDLSEDNQTHSAAVNSGPDANPVTFLLPSQSDPSASYRVDNPQ